MIVNASNLSSGGAYTILRNFYKWAPQDSIFLVKDEVVEKKLRLVRTEGPQIVIVPSWVRTPWGLLFFYCFWLDHFTRRMNGSRIISLGNIAARTKLSQTVYLHWPYFAYGLRGGWSEPRSFVIRFFRYLFIRLFIRYADDIVVQTEAMCAQMKRRFGSSLVANVRVVYPGFDSRSDEIKRSWRHLKVSKSVIKLIYPALYYSHKNFEIVSEFASTIDRLSLPYTISLTLPQSDFMRLGLSSYACVTNLGVLTREALDKQYLRHHALFMPTRLETFGLPYLEAMSLALPIITSDADFARDVCGEYAVYFQSDSVNSLVKALEELRVRIDSRHFEMVGREQLKKFPSWQESVALVLN